MSGEIDELMRLIEREAAQAHWLMCDHGLIDVMGRWVDKKDKPPKRPPGRRKPAFF